MIMSVPFIDLKRFESNFLSSWTQRVQELSQTASFIGGDEVNKLESKLCNYLNVKHAITCANGTDAIQLALRALGVGIGDVVVIPDMTFWATFESVVNVGAKVVTVDINLSDGGVLFQDLEVAIKKHKPKAVIIANLFGWASSRLDDIRELCMNSNIALIEDGAQSFGVKFKEESIYSGAYISTSSFYPAKVFGAAGDAGAVFTNNDELAASVRQLTNHGRSTHYGHELVGWNSRMDTLQAAYLNLSITNLDEKVKSRISSANKYRKSINNPKVQVISAPTDVSENGYCNVCLITDLKYKEKLEKLLKSNSIGYGNIYPSPMSKQTGAEKYLIDSIGVENSQVWCDSVLNLPLFPYMKDEELELVINLVNEC